jgi:hypothetical protein
LLSSHIHLCKSSPIDYQTLAARGQISPDRVKKTILNMTQQGVWTCVIPTLSRCFPMNDRMLHYKRLPHTTFTDTMFAGSVSKQGNKAAQVFAMSFGWARAHPLRCKGEAHEALSLLFHHDGVPPVMVCNNSKEQHSNDFRRKLREADCHLRTTEPYLPWQQAVEGCIRELKQGVSRQMLSTGSPKALWDHCLVLQALICSCTSNDIYMTNWQVLGTIMTNSTADISHIAEFAWYDWVMFRDNTPTFPDEALTLGCYLGPALDVGSALTANILKANGHTLRNQHCAILQTRSLLTQSTVTSAALLTSPSPIAWDLIVPAMTFLTLRT